MTGFAMVQSRAVLGLEAPSVTVEVHLANGLPSFTLVGLAETEVKEARERVRSALQNSNLTFPHNKRITVNLAPADLPKDSGRFDLPIALGILAASAQIDPALLVGHEFAGELSLSGELRTIRGALAMSLAMNLKPTKDSQMALRLPIKLVLPIASAAEAALVPDAWVFGAQHLLDVVAQFDGGVLHQKNDVALGWQKMTCPDVDLANGIGSQRYLDFADVKGQAGAKRALEIAAAGGHSALLVGPPGAGKSMLAQRFAGLLPPMATQEALESAAIASLVGRFDVAQWGQRPTRSPHHSASSVALVGGGSPPKPGEISLSHNGVLFLDELPELSRAALEALREPLETGHITISRAARRADFPARFQLIAAMNPCPCGYLGATAGSTPKMCRCSPDQVARYQGKLSGPLLDRIDLHIDVPTLPIADLINTPAGENTITIRQRCHQARDMALARQGKPNHALQGAEIDAHVLLDETALKFLNSAAAKLGWSARATHRTLKVARTIADLAHSHTTQVTHVAEAMQYRRAVRSMG